MGTRALALVLSVSAAACGGGGTSEGAAALDASAGTGEEAGGGSRIDAAISDSGAAADAKWRDGGGADAADGSLLFMCGDVTCYACAEKACLADYQYCTIKHVADGGAPESACHTYPTSCADDHSCACVFPSSNDCRETAVTVTNETFP